ncbi:MAG: Sec-independent protein translocase protein TatB [Gammaproteobacteria bacterium]|nr:Sec-independent protein translocase protein TatB [Gammaproteobacteria bacterium]
MFGIGGQELVLLMVIGLIVLGPERLPRIANQVGGWLGQARRMTRVMKRQLEEELDLNQPLSIKPPPASREPSTKPKTETEAGTETETETEAETISAKEPEYTLPRDDDDFSPAHGEEDPGTGVSEDIYDDEADLAASEAERAAVEEAARNPIEEEKGGAEQVKEADKKEEIEKEKEAS